MHNLSTVLQHAMSSYEVLAVLVAALLSAIGWFAVRVYVGFGKVAWGFSHQHACLLREQDQQLLAYTREVYVQNVGRSIAEDVEVILSAKPQHFDIWPKRNFEEFLNPDTSFTIKLENLNSREHVAIWMLQTAVEPPLVANVRWRGGMGKQRPIAPQQVYSRPFRMFLTCMLLLGFFSFWYFAFRIFF